MAIITLEWRTWMKHGDQYLKAFTNYGANSRFNTEIQYNLLSMSLEAYIMAILDFHGTMPDNHTYTDLMNAVEGVINIDYNLKKRILKFESIQSICSIEKYHTEKPSNEDIIELREAIQEIGELAHQTCIQDAILKLA